MRSASRASFSSTRSSTRTRSAIWYQNEVRNLDASIAGQRFHGVKAKKFEVYPLPNHQIELTMTVYVHPDSGRQVSILAEHVMDDVMLQLEPQPDLGLEDTREGKAA